MSGRIAVIGPGGYLGAALVPALAQAGYRITGAGRHVPAHWPQGAIFQRVDATDGAALLEAIGTSDGVINAMNGAPAAIVRVARALAHCRAEGWQGHIVHISSRAVYGQQTGVFDEASRPQPAPGHAYARAKLAAEALLAGRGTTILRPGCIYGPAAPVWLDRLCLLLRARRLGWLWDEGAGPCPLVHVQDLARIAILALQAGPAAEGVHNLECAETLTWNMYIHRLALGLGVGAMPRISAMRLDIETYAWGPLRHALAQAGMADTGSITPAMRRLFRGTARIVSNRAPLLAAADHTSLTDGIAQALADFHGRYPAPPRRMAQAGIQAPWQAPA
jgi:nucleoside-diphosphate-sugar epimerase